MDVQRIYFSLPIFMQEWVLSHYAHHLDRMYYGPDFARWVEYFTVSERLPRERQLDNQRAALQRIFSLAFAGVPWFRELAARTGLIARECEPLEVLRRLPLMEKDPIRHDPWRFVREDYPRKLLWLEKTSGTTGNALRIYWSREMLPWWWALQEVRVRRWAGVGQELPRATVGGRPVVRGETHHPPYWRYNRRWRQLYMSSYHISPTTAPAYIEALQRYGSQWVTGYGSAIALLGEYLQDHPTELPIHAAVTSGDTVTPYQRQAIERGFRCRMFDNYGSAEACGLITECHCGRMHLQPEAGFLEILDEQGEPCPPEVDGEFIFTSLGNDAMPLIRYRTGDYGCWSSEQYCPCGRESLLVKHITGRMDDYLELPDGRRIGRLSTAMKKAPSVRQAQLVQDAPNHAWLLLVPESYYRDQDGEAVQEDILSRIGEKAIQIEVRTVPEVLPTPVGKYVLVRRILHDPVLQERYRALITREHAGATR